MVGIDYSIRDIQKAIHIALPVEFKRVSSDAKEYESFPFVRKGKRLVKAFSEPERAVAFIEIRGSSRPYNIDVTVEIQAAANPQDVNKDFQVVGYDEVVAKIFLARLRSHLQRSNRKGNVVDDFRVY